MRKAILLLALLLTVAIGASAQITQVSGVVLDADDDSPLVGATVMAIGSKKATSTDLDGAFSLSGLSSTDRKITVSYVGYQTATVDAGKDMVIKLMPASEMLEEVIAVAFGKQKRESFTGSATTISAADIAKTQVANPIKALDGKVAGVNMTMSNGLDSDPSILVRGISSLNASTSPLIVLDGMPYNGYWTDINPQDIENITVLKDAASNALYGARGANGVILITTKSAKRGNTQVNLDARWGVATDARVQYNTIDDPGQYYEAQYLALYNYSRNALGMTQSAAHVNANQTLSKSASQGGLAYMVYSVPENQYLIGTNGRLNPNATLGNRIAYNGDIYTLYPDNWRKEGIRDGFRQEYNLSITGGNEQFKFLASLGYLDEDGLAYGNDLTRYSARIKTEYQAYKWLRVGANASYTNKVGNYASSVFSVAYDIAPIYPLYTRDANGNVVYDSHGKLYDMGGGQNAGLIRPVLQNQNSLADDQYNLSQNSTNAFNIQGFLTADLTHGFELTVNGNVYITENRMKYGYAPYYGYSASTGGTVDVEHYRTSAVNYQQLLNYSNKFGVHSVSALLGHEYTRNSSSSLTASRTQVANFEGNTELNGAVVTVDNSSYKSLYNVDGYFLRAQYDYDNRYFGSGSFRRDGSSRFHPKHRWGSFWSLGGAWIATREDWFPKNKILNMLKVKLSYGQQGNDGIGSYRYVDTYTIKNSNDEVAYVFSSKGNENITWETVGCLNLGLEFEMFGQRLRGGLEYYDRKTTDMLMYLYTPMSLGYSGYYTNIGDMSNRGIELTLSADLIVTPHFRWSVDGNLSWQRNRVTYLPDDVKEYTIEGYSGMLNGETYIAEGLPMYTWYMPHYAGVAEDGQALYSITNADGSIGTTTSYSDASYYLCGSALPTVYGGFSTNFKIYDFDLSANFGYSIGGKKFDSGYQALMTSPTGSLTGRALHRDIFRGWTETNTNTDIPRFQYQDQYTTSYSDRWLTDASYLSLNNITLGYTMPQRLSRKFFVENLRFYVTADNIYYWTKRKGFDPRTGLLYGSYGGYSPIRSISGGLTVKF
jgi:TonB-linked SusC/RagA family outer membrane protein